MWQFYLKHQNLTCHGIGLARYILNNDLVTFSNSSLVNLLVLVIMEPSRKVSGWALVHVAILNLKLNVKLPNLLTETWHGFAPYLSLVYFGLRRSRDHVWQIHGLFTLWKPWWPSFFPNLLWQAVVQGSPSPSGWDQAVGWGRGAGLESVVLLKDILLVLGTDLASPKANLA